MKSSRLITAFLATMLSSCAGIEQEQQTKTAPFGKVTADCHNLETTHHNVLTGANVRHSYDFQKQQLVTHDGFMTLYSDFATADRSLLLAAKALHRKYKPKGCE